MRGALASLRGVVIAVLLVGTTGALAASANDPDLRGAWKGTGADAKWVANFLPNDTYQFRLGDSPTGSRGRYIARNGKFELLEGNQKFMYGSYRVEDCNVLVLDTSKGVVRFNRSGSVPTGGCGKARPDAAPAARSAAVPVPAASSASGGTSSARTAPAPAPSQRPATSGVARPASPKAVPTAQPSGQKSAQATTTAKAATQKVTGAAAEAGTAVKAGAVTLWDKTKSVTHKAVEVGGKAAKTVGHKAQEAGRAVANTVRKAGDDAEAEAKPEP